MTLNISINSLENLESSLAALRTRYSQAQGQRDLLVSQRREKQNDLTAAQADIELWRDVQVLLSKASEFAREQLKTRIEQTVTAALAAIFDSSMKFEIEMGNIGGRPAADWRVVSSCGDIGSGSQVSAVSYTHLDVYKRQITSIAVDADYSR